MKYPIFITDDAARQINIKQKPERIISLVPSITELIADLGCSSNLVARTMYCKHPSDLEGNVPVIGGTQHVDIESIIKLKPDLIIANKEENLQSDINKLEEYFPVFVTHVRNVEESLLLIHTLGQLLDHETEAANLIKQLHKSINNIPCLIKPLQVLYLIWRMPYVSVSQDTYTGNLIEKLNFKNIVAYEQKNYPDLSIEKLSTLNPQIIMLASEPYNFTPKHELELSLIFPKAHIIHVDGEMFSWYGTRMLKKPEYFAEMINKLDKLLHTPTT